MEVHMLTEGLEVLYVLGDDSAAKLALTKGF